MIYYVEDDTNIRDLTVYALKQAGFEAAGFPAAGEFFAACKERLPELVLLDIMLPEIDGLEILHMLRENPATKHLPVMMLTAKGTEFDTVSGLDAGADDYLAKPFGMMELVSRVNALMRRASAPPVMADDELSCGPIELCVSAHAQGVRPAAHAAAEPGARAVAQPTAGRRVGYDVRGGDAHGGCARADAAPEAGRGARRGRRPRSYGARRGLLHQTLLVSARMSPTHFKVKSLSGKIFTSVLAFTLAVIVALSVTMTTIYYLSYEHDAETELAASAQDAARYLNATPSSENAPALKEQFSGLTRYTLIDADGTVLFDSAADTDAMDNHADRPEVQEAADMGEAVTMRYSETLGTDTVYAAVKLDDGSIVRLSETRHSLLSFLSEMLMPVLIALIVAVALVFLLSKILTSRIMKPIDALDFANPLDNEIYEEMDPLLIRIDEQQRQLKQQNSELAEAENMRRDFSSNVSHEMKTPLQVISGYAELMKNDMVQPSDRQKFAALIYDEAQTMRSLINDVLTLSKLDESAFENDGATAINLYAVAQRVAGRLSSFADDQGVRVRVEGASACIAGSETLAEEMLYNLIENGIRYNHEGGLVTMKVGSECVEGGLANAAYQTVVRVSDTGPGIPAELHDKVFERFFRVDKSRSKETGGTGLGLAIVKHAVMYHGGVIEVESAEGQGTTFVLRFPSA